MLLDQEGFECDPISLREGDTPLHSAIRYINSLPPSAAVTEFSTDLITMMTEAGSDPRLKNKANLTPYQLVDPTNVALRQQLQDTVDIMQNAGDFVDEGGADGEEVEEDMPDDYAGSASDSDFDPEEYRREREKKKTEERKEMSEANGGMI
jgi:ankyrin repeat protein